MTEVRQSSDQKIVSEIEKKIMELPEVSALATVEGSNLVSEVSRVWGKKNDTKSILLRRDSKGLFIDVALKVTANAVTKAFGEKLQDIIGNIVRKKTQEPLLSVRIYIVDLVE